MKLVLIPPGEFTMGSLRSGSGVENGRRSDEDPQHRVRITKAFYLGEYAVTQGEYEQVMGKNPSWFSANGGGKDKVSGLDTSRFPVETVSWDDAVEFCRKLSEKERQKYRLPTEAEWEHACRAGTATAFHFGDSLNGREANCVGSMPYGTEEKGPYLWRPKQVGSYRPNAFGLYDMHGNILQWCADWYDYYGSSPVDDPTGPSGGCGRVIRGGSWDSPGKNCRSAFRGWDGKPGSRLGLRVSRVAAGEPTKPAQPEIAPLHGSAPCRQPQPQVPPPPSAVSSAPTAGGKSRPALHRLPSPRSTKRRRKSTKRHGLDTWAFRPR